MNAANTDSQFTRDIARYLWDSATLKKRSVTGRACQYKLEDGAQSKPAMISGKLNAEPSRGTLCLKKNSTCFEAYGAYVRGHPSKNRPEGERINALNKHLASMLWGMH